MSFWTARMVVVAVACGVAGAAAGQQPAPGGLLARSNWFRLELVGGRIQLIEPRVGHKATLAVECPETGAVEVLGFAAITADQAMLHYEYRSGAEHWTVEIEGGRQVRIRRRSLDGPSPDGLQYDQPPSGPVSLVLHQDGRTQQLSAADFWRLTLAEPAACGEHLLPLLKTLRRDWALEALVQDVEEALLAAAASDSMPDGQRLEWLIEELGAAEFHRRQAADRQLREMGQRIAGFLDRLDLRPLDGEQRSRIRGIQRSLRIPQRDTPPRVAAWLIDDPAVWLALLDREDSQTRVAAAAQLARLLERPLEFDPLAADTERQQQLSRLKTDLQLERPLLIGSPAAGPLRR